MKLASVLHWMFISGGIVNSYAYCHSFFPPQEIDLIKAITIDKNSLVIEIEEKFKKAFLRDNFFATYDSDIDLSIMDYSIITMPFILNIISIIWISGKDYFIDSMDEDVYRSLSLIKRVMCRLYPKTSWDGNLIPRRLVKNLPKGPLKDPEKESALFFSGGLDSTSSALSSLDKKLLLITVRGQWDVPLSDDQLWKEREKEFRNFAHKYGHKNAFVRSNFAEFLNWDALESLSDEVASWRLDTAEGIGLYGLAAPIVYEKGYPLTHIAASYSWSYPWPSSANPLIDNHMRFASAFKLEHDQFNYLRVDKIELIAHLAKQGLIDRPVLKACDSRKPINCLHNNCSKCIPTAFMLLALGENPRLYGFEIADDLLAEAAKKYLSTKRFYWTLWELQALRDKLKERGPLDAKFSWFMDLNLARLMRRDYLKDKEKVSWRSYKDLVPSALKIPKIDIKELE